MTLRCRPATTGDIDGIVAAFLGCWLVSYAAVLPRSLVDAMTPRRAGALWTRALAEAADGEVIVAESTDRSGPGIIGVTRWGLVPTGGDVPDGVVHSLYVSPPAHGQGVGSALLEVATERLAAAGVASARLWVFRDNAPSVAFYRRSGWLPDGSTRVQPEFGEPEICLTKKLSTPRPTEGTAELDAVAARLVATAPDGSPEGTTPPAGVAVALGSSGRSEGRSGAVDVHAVAGLRTVGTAATTAAPLTVDTHHDLASVTKIVATTTALLGLVSDGLIGLDDPARRYLPGFRDGQKSVVTVRDLLLHRAGLWEWQPIYVAASGADAVDDFVDRLPLRYRPGSARHYSDLGFMLLGRIVAAVGGASFGEAVEALVTGPLGMTSTRFGRPASPIVAMSSFDDSVEMAMIDSGDPYPVPFRSADFPAWRTAPVVGEVNDGNAFHAYGGTAGHAGLFSDLADLIRFGEALARSDEHDDLWRPDVTAAFFAPGPDDGQSVGFRRYPIVIDGDRAEMLGHTGFVGCAVGFVPGRGIALAMASNRLVTAGTPVPTDDLWQQVRAAAGTALSERP